MRSWILVLSLVVACKSSDLAPSASTLLEGLTEPQVKHYVELNLDDKDNPFLDAPSPDGHVTLGEVDEAARFDAFARRHGFVDARDYLAAAGKILAIKLMLEQGAAPKGNATEVAVVKAHLAELDALDKAEQDRLAKRRRAN